MTDKDATRRSRRRGIDACVQGQLVGCRGKAVCLLRGAHDRESTGTHTDTPSYTPCASNFNSPACRKGQKAKVRWRRPARLLLPLTTYRYTQGLGARAVFLPGPGLLPVHRLLTPGTRETPCNLFRFRRSQIHVYERGDVPGHPVGHEQWITWYRPMPPRRRHGEGGQSQNHCRRGGV